MVMKPDELEPFLHEPRVAVLSTVGADGTPLPTPIWYEYRDGKFLMSTGKKSQKAKNIQANPRVSLCIDERSMPYKGVAALGTATISDEDVAETMYRIFGGYVPEAVAKQMADSYLRQQPNVIISVFPLKFISWDYSFYSS
jgi:PPOX class probable F420-dependent enzyme